MFIYRIYAATPHFFRTFVNIPINFVNKFLQKPQGLKPISREMELSVIMKQLSALCDFQLKHVNGYITPRYSQVQDTFFVITCVYSCR